MSRNVIWSARALDTMLIAAIAVIIAYGPGARRVSALQLDLRYG